MQAEDDIGYRRKWSCRLFLIRPINSFCEPIDLFNWCLLNSPSAAAYDWAAALEKRSRALSAQRLISIIYLVLIMVDCLTSAGSPCPLLAIQQVAVTILQFLGTAKKYTLTCSS